MRKKTFLKFIFLFLTVGFVFSGLVAYAGFPIIPQNIREQVQEKDLVEVVCLMSKWKTGEYFATLDSLQEILVPALTELKNMGISVDIPDISANRAKAEEKLNVVCNADTYEGARDTALQFVNFTQEIKGGFGSLRTSLSSELKAKVKSMKSGVEEGLKKWVEQENMKIATEVEKKTAELGNRAQSQLVLEMQKKGFKKTEDATAYATIRANEIKKQIESEIIAYSDGKKAEIDENIKNKASEILGFDVDKWIAIGDKLNGIEGLINQSTAEKKESYNKYRDEAFSKRKEMILVVVNKNLDMAAEKIKEQEEYLRVAKEKDSSIKSVKEHLAELNADKDKLKNELLSMDLESEEDFSRIIGAVREKWQGVRERLEKDMAKKYSVKNVCGEIFGQITAGRAQLGAGLKQIQVALVEIEANKNGCELSEKPICEKVNEIYNQLLVTKLGAENLLEKLNDIDKGCASVSTETKWDKEFLAEVMGLKTLALNFKQDVNSLKTKWLADKKDLERELAEKPTVKIICLAINPGTIKKSAEAQVLDLEIRLENCGKPCIGTPEACSLRADTCNLYRTRINKFNLADELGIKLVAGLELMEQKCVNPAKQTLKDIVSIAKDIKTKAMEFDTARDAAIGIRK